MKEKHGRLVGHWLLNGVLGWGGSGLFSCMGKGTVPGWPGNAGKASAVPLARLAWPEESCGGTYPAERGVCLPVRV